MSLDQIIEALDILANSKNADVIEYIKTFDGDGGFMYTRETEPNRIALKNKMETIINQGPHSGASWGCMLRAIQASLIGIDGYSYEQLITEKNRLRDEEENVNNEWRKIIEEEKEREAEGRGIEYRRVVLEDGWEKMQEWEQKWYVKDMIKKGDIIAEQAKAVVVEEGLHLKESEYETSLKQ
jgi:hypothetical protein